MLLNVLNNSALSPRWSSISRAALWAMEARREKIPYERRFRSLLTAPGANTKLSKGSVPIFGLTLAPAGMSGYQLCPWRSAECEAACLGVTAGRSRFSNVQQARINKTRFLMEHSILFFRHLYDELAAANRKYGHGNWAFRSNVLSDIPWEKVAPEVYAWGSLNYDYTKSFARALRSLEKHSPVRLTLSYSGHNWDDCRQYLNAGGNVAMVFNTKRDRALPNKHEGWAVIDGDLSDARFNDPVGGVIVGLRAKGNIKPSPFVVHAG